MRAPGIRGVKAWTSKRDPAFDIDGLPDPYDTFFPVLIHNGHTARIYVGAVLSSPPAGWTDSEDQLGYVNVGYSAFFEKDNATRAVMGVPTNETVTLRCNYYSDAGYSVLIGYDDLAITIYWESVTAGTIDDTDDFELTLEGWAKTDEVGSTSVLRSSTRVYSGIFSMEHRGIDDGDVAYLSKTVVIGAGTRAYVFGWVNAEYSWKLVAGGSMWMGPSLQIITPVETVFLPVCSPERFSRFGARLNPGASNEVRLRAIGRDDAEDSMFYDLIRWVRY